MKLFTTVAASVVAVLLGARLAFAAFAPVLPPDFHRASDRDYERAALMLRWVVPSATEVFHASGVWPATIEDLFSGPRDADWKERSPESWADWVDRFRAEIELDRTDGGLELVVNETLDGPHAVSCSIQLDASYADVWEEWVTGRGARWVPELPGSVDPVNFAVCRRSTGVRGWFAWAGLDRYREGPPDRYAQMSYAERAWGEEGPGTRLDPLEYDD